MPPQQRKVLPSSADTVANRRRFVVQSSVRHFSFRAELIRSIALIAWDDLPAANVAWLDCVDNICRSLLKKDVPFRGITFLGIGDFRQVAPVVKGIGCAPAQLASEKLSRVAIV
ncbi:hypothetical protein DFH94DRAFT_230907 [Russula ochroleuca]|uniref:ATP-dependent DNA helicase n=1 Tax=Russula ochroleuca TaxID=152965 RepID=A0A9P5JWZ6_9AGAM|nr:hypothetical protein DFH94DRAFT_230907 [Russula ochroleuca]